MNCPFCKTEIELTFKDRMVGLKGCTACGAKIDKRGEWRNAEGNTAFYLRMNNLPSTTSYNGIVANPHSLIIKGKEVSYFDITQIEFKWDHNVTNSSFNYISMGTHHDYNAMLKITIENEGAVTLRAGSKSPIIDIGITTGGLFRDISKIISTISTGMTPKEQCEELCVLSEIIHRNSFDHRTNKYITQINTNGHFDYGKFIIFRNANVSDGKSTINLKKCNRMRKASAYVIKCFPRDTLQNKEIEFTIPTDINKDAFYAVIDKLLKYN